MGEVADETLTGFRCLTCAQIIDDDAPGYARNCDDCLSLEEEKPQ